MTDQTGLGGVAELMLGFANFRRPSEWTPRLISQRRADLSHALLIQTRWMLGGFALVLTAILFKG